MTDHKVCIIGAGSCGMVAAKIMHERGIPFDCFEKGSAIGGLWRYNNDNGMSAAYESLHINTSRDKMRFSDFPMPKNFPDFPHHSQVLEYFESYVDRFGFRDKINFRTSVSRVEPVVDGTYDVTVRAADGALRTKRYSAVLIANGHHWCPNSPDFPGEFSGRAMHSHDYKTPQDMHGKRILVIGIGNSGCDIACEVSRIAKQTFLSTRRGAHVIPKYIFGKPMDKICPPFAWRYLPFRVFQWIFDFALRIARGRQSRFGLPTPQHKILEEHPTISSDLLNLIGHGRIHVKPNVKELAGETVRFDDGTEQNFDVIIYATGYKVAFPFLDKNVIDPKSNEVSLYKHVVSPERPNLYIIGLVQPWGAIMPLAELQSEWVADLIEGKTCLPSRSEMWQDIQNERDKMRNRYTKSPRHTMQVDFYPYVSELQKERKRRRNRFKREPTEAIRRAA